MKGEKMLKKGLWEEHEKQYLRDHYNGHDIKELSSFLSRSEQGIIIQLKKLGIYKSRRWTYEQDRYLVDSVSTKFDCEIAKRLGRTESAIVQRKRTLGLSTSNGTSRPWTEEEDAHVVSLASSKLTHKEMGEPINRSAGSVAARLKHLRKKDNQMQSDLKSHGIYDWLYRYGPSVTRKDVLRKLKHTGLSQGKLEGIYKDWRDEHMQTSNI